MEWSPCTARFTISSQAWLRQIHTSTSALLPTPPSSTSFHSYLKPPFFPPHLIKPSKLTPIPQFHSTPSTRAALAAILGGEALSPLAKYDAVCEFLVQDLEVFTRAFADPSWALDLKPDEDYLFDRSKTHIAYVGRELVMVDGGVVTELGRGEGVVGGF